MLVGANWNSISIGIIILSLTVVYLQVFPYIFLNRSAHSTFIFHIDCFLASISIDTAVLRISAVLHVFSEHLHVFFTYLRPYSLLHTFLYIQLPRSYSKFTRSSALLYVFLQLQVMGVNWNFEWAPIGNWHRYFVLIFSATRNSDHLHVFPISFSYNCSQLILRLYTGSSAFSHVYKH